MNQNHKFIGYYQWGQKIQPNRLPLRHVHLPSTEGRPTAQDSGSWVYKAEWNGTISDKLYVEARYGDFGYYFPQITNGTEPTSSATPARSRSSARTRRTRTIAIASSGPARPPTSSIPAKGSHTLKVGGELLKELQWFGVLQGVGGNIEHVYNNGVVQPGDLPHSRRRRRSAA